MAARSSAAPSRIRKEEYDKWIVAEKALALFSVLMVSARIAVGGNLVVADLLALALLPLWLPVLARYRGATSLVALGVAACISSWMLTHYAAIDHRTSAKLGANIIKILLSMLGSLGLVLWARERLQPRWIYVAFGLGMLVAGPTNAKLFAENPWKFGFSVPLTIIVVGFVAERRRPRSTVALLLLFGLVCTVTDARSNFAVLLLTVVLILWRLMPRLSSRRSTILGTLGVLGAIAVAAYYLVQAAILDGALGAETQARSIEQLRTSGSLLVGGRPEMGATLALFQHRPMGFGGGTFLNTSELLVAKNGMATLNYDPNNGYVERFMFGRGTELHSITADLWAWAGLVGLLFALVIAGQVLAGLGHALNTRPVSSAVLIFCCLMTLWNLAFSPWVASLPMTALTLGLGMVPHGQHVLRRGRSEEL